MHHVVAIEGEMRAKGLKLKKSVCCLLSCKRTNSYDTPAVEFILFGCFFVLNDLATKVQNHFIQSMRCISCHPMVLTFNSSNTMQSRKNIIFYNPTHGITSMMKHVENVHRAIMNRYK